MRRLKAECGMGKGKVETGRSAFISLRRDMIRLHFIAARQRDVGREKVGDERRKSN